MKRILSAAALLFVLVLVSPAQEKLLPQWIARDSTIYTTRWDSIGVTGLSYQMARITVANDSGSGTIAVARQNDTTAANYFTCKAGETIGPFPVNNAKWLRIKALIADVHGRVWVY
jgi:hypothetical protein